MGDVAYPWNCQNEWNLRFGWWNELFEQLENSHFCFVGAIVVYNLYFLY